MAEYLIYRNNVIEELQALSDRSFQEVAWFENDQGLAYFFNDIVNDIFDDFNLEKALYEEGVTVFSRDADVALRDLNDAVELIGADVPESVIIDLPEMEVVRQKAAKALALVLASDGSESTVEIVE